MSNSAWYANIWRKKLEEVPVQKDAETLWTSMAQLLDKELPVAGNIKKKSFGAVVISLLGYIIPAAAMIGGVTIAIVHIATTQTTAIHQPKHKAAHHRNGVYGSADSLATDDSLAIKNIDSAKITPDNKATLSSAIIKQQIAKAGINKANPTTTTPDSARSKQVIAAKRQIAIVRTLRHPSPSLAITAQSQNTRVSNQRQNDLSHPVVNTIKDLVSGKNTDSQTDKVKNLHDSVKTGNDFSILFPDTKPTNQPVVKKPDEKAKIKNDSQLKNNKPDALKPIKTKGNTSAFLLAARYGLEAGINMDKGNSLYFGAYGGFSMNDKWQLTMGARVTSGIPVSGEYTHPSFYKPDSSIAFHVTDARKVTSIDIPVNVKYNVTDQVFIKAGPVLRFNISQHQTSSSTIIPHNLTDTLFYGRTISDAINKTTVNKVGIGFNGGIGFSFKQFDIEGRYQLLSPFKISNDIGKYSMANHSFQLGISYRIK